MDTSDSPVKLRKNRRKITRKTPANPSAFPTASTSTSTSDPSSSSSHRRADDDEMAFDAPVDQEVAASSFATAGSQLMQQADEDDELMIDTDAAPAAAGSAPAFAPVTPGAEKTTLKSETRRVPIPPHRMTPLKKDWLNIFGPLTEILGLQVRMNVQRRCVEIRVRFHFLYSRICDSVPDGFVLILNLISFRRRNSQRTSARSRKVPTLSRHTH
jgi:RNA-binding protein PNO1